jgi:hypothetical protein
MDCEVVLDSLDLYRVAPMPNMQLHIRNRHSYETERNATSHTLNLQLTVVAPSFFFSPVCHGHSETDLEPASVHNLQSIAHRSRTQWSMFTYHYALPSRRTADADGHASGSGTCLSSRESLQTC